MWAEDVEVESVEVCRRSKDEEEKDKSSCSWSTESHESFELPVRYLVENLAGQM